MCIRDRCQLEDIAVITPYTKQVQKIKDALYYMLVNKGVLLGNVRPRPPLPMPVSTVDSFQGRESRVVILSCVRSNVESAASDLRFSLGFLQQPERANVAMSRAKDLLVVLGNRQLLSLDPTFNEYFTRMEALGACKDDVSVEQHQYQHQHLDRLREMVGNTDDDDMAVGVHETYVRHV
eukprot:TRINITY_DN61761_c0_g1_i1.p1 TRINITY_DN61761_c0_g1~~TRINITY_DN61761_c0_g1_i1.p1  ORF type:complete len:179 (+),score=32.47 TRINITY_DN61761_c0_g1_i1:80-616(+)